MTHQENFAAIATLRGSLLHDKEIRILQTGWPGCLPLSFGSRCCLTKALVHEEKFKMETSEAPVTEWPTRGEGFIRPPVDRRQKPQYQPRHISEIHDRNERCAP
jgi:hypothetical protein